MSFRQDIQELTIQITNDSFCLVSIPPERRQVVPGAGRSSLPEAFFILSISAETIAINFFVFAACKVKVGLLVGYDCGDNLRRRMCKRPEDVD